MDSYRIRVRLFASLQKWMPDNPVDHVVSGSTTVGEFLRERGVPANAVAIVMRNGKRAGLDAILTDGDSFDVFPLIGGG
jgi:sulfur carrier protein ThiS